MEGCLRLNTGLNHDSNTVSHSEEWHTDIGWHIPLQQAKSMAKERSQFKHPKSVHHTQIVIRNLRLRRSSPALWAGRLDVPNASIPLPQYTAPSAKPPSLSWLMVLS